MSVQFNISYYQGHFSKRNFREVSFLFVMAVKEKEIGTMREGNYFEYYLWDRGGTVFILSNTKATDKG